MDSMTPTTDEFDELLPDDYVSTILDDISLPNDQLNHDHSFHMNNNNANLDETDSLNLLLCGDNPISSEDLLNQNDGLNFSELFCLQQYDLDTQPENTDFDQLNTFFDGLLYDDSNEKTALGDSTTELSYILPDVFENSVAIIEHEQVIENSNTTNTEIIQLPTQGPNTLFCQIYPSLFTNIDGTISVKQQPTANKKPRYQCDGKRFLPNSRRHPMSLNLPNLQSISVLNNQTIGIVATMITNSANPRNQSMIHANDFICYESGTEKLAYACSFIPIKQAEIQSCEKILRYCSIEYKKYSEYSFDLIPFDSSTIFGSVEKFSVPDQPNLTGVPLGKIFKKTYNLSTYKIVFHLALKQDNCIYISNITCETNEIHELCELKSSEAKAEKSGKRTRSTLVKDVTDVESELDMPKRKQFCSSSSRLLDQLPVTRFSNALLNTNYEQ